MVLHDLACDACGHTEINALVDVRKLPACIVCFSPMEIRYDLSPRRVTAATVHPSERAVVWRHPVTGKVAYPGRNDAPMTRYAKRGFERVEMDSLHKLDSFCRETGVVNEKAHFNNGNSYDDGDNL